MMEMRFPALNNHHEEWDNFIAALKINGFSVLVKEQPNHKVFVEIDTADETEENYVINLFQSCFRAPVAC